MYNKHKIYYIAIILNIQSSSIENITIKDTSQERQKTKKIFLQKKKNFKE